MKATGIVRRIDDLGRIAIPKEIRRSMKFREGDALEIFLEDDMVCFQKYKAEAEEEERKEKMRKFVRGKMSQISFFFCENCVTTVILNDGRKASVKYNPNDEFDVNIAIYYALEKLGFRIE